MCDNDSEDTPLAWEAAIRRSLEEDNENESGGDSDRSVFAGQGYKPERVTSEEEAIRANRKSEEFLADSLERDRRAYLEHTDEDDHW